MMKIGNDNAVYGQLTWPAPYLGPQYINIPSPAAGLNIGINYSNSPQFVPGIPPNGFQCSPVVNINMSGNYATDRARTLAVLAAAPIGWLPVTGQRYDCHHTYSFVAGINPSCFSQMVLTIDHNASKLHAGAVVQYRWQYGRGYAIHIDELPGFAEQNILDDISLVSPVSLSNSDVDGFEKQYGVKLPDWLRTIFIDNASVKPYFKTADNHVESVQSVIPLLVQSNRECSVGDVLSIDETKDVLKKLGPSLAIPFAFDPCGNIFFALADKIFFFEHECCEFTEVIGVEKP